MRGLRGVAWFLAVLALVPWASAEVYHSDWWDVSHCGYCWNFSTHPGLLESMEWEEYSVSNGLVSILRTDQKHLSALRAALSGLREAEAKAARGEKVETCGMCDAIGLVLLAGAEKEHIPTPDGEITLLTSGDARVVVEIHAILERNEAESRRAAEFAKQ
ncbi:MAG: hypothetical protein KDA27_18805 [Candidatus Eisenbacteria bacterium]|uniref:Uncharacterized protein n=1 Tax=Eiseniibacteriota bacterium TaxID=2212470 RepID=A0A956SFU2_UNCEI|nr:hypothetical protein [Candidatus Eisenbacteria bacterium]MCB9466157.1 hypothetical protein [Candidatus Eisenbacteria bacterium]